MIENFEKLSFERKVDVLVAIHVFKYENIYIQWMGTYWLCTWLGDIGSANTIPLHSTLLTSAWDIVRKFGHMELVKNTHTDGVLWQCKLGEVGVIQEYGIAETAQLAICYAGLKAVGYPIEDFLKEEGKEIIIGS